MTELPSWESGDISALRDFCPEVANATDTDMREVLNGYHRRGLRKPVAFAKSQAASGQLARDLGEIVAKRRKAELGSALEELRRGPECPHGRPGGASPRPDNDLPDCPNCRAEAPAQDPAPDTARDSRDNEVSPDSMPSDQGKQAAGDSRDIPVSLLRPWNARELLAQKFPPTRYAVEGLIPDGVTVLAGAPKVGKSWLALNLAVSVASGSKALDAIETVQGDVLYLALEDTARRLQRRLRQVVGDGPIPEQLALSIECPPTPAEATGAIRWWLSGHPDARLVVIDVFERIRGPLLPHETHYSAEYRVVSAMKRMADQHGISVVLIHHIRKMSSEDFLNEISGTTGLSGAADTIAVLKRARGEHDGTLSITGRDVEESEHALKFHADRGAWELLGPAAEYALTTETQRQVIAHLRDGHEGSTPAAVAKAIGQEYERVKKTMQRMVGDSLLERGTGGRYYLPKLVPGVPEH